MFTAFKRFETLDYAANLEILARRIGAPKPLGEAAYKVTLTRTHLKMDDFIPSSHSVEELAARRDMITLIRRSYKQGLFTATHGTYSVRLSDGSFLITPFGLDRAYLEEDNLVRVKSGMKELGKTPSRAVGLHQEIYDANPNIRAVLLAHPVHAMAFAVTDAKFDPRTIPESYILLRDIKRIPYGKIYTHQKETAKVFTDSCPAVMVENDCVIVTGETLLKAFDRLEVMESTATSIILSKEVGPIVHITDEEVDDLKVAFRLKD
jgi:L-fuculose-phosphate aldolase